MIHLCVEMLERLIPILEDPENRDRVFFLVELSCYVSGMMNKHNCRIRTANDPFVTVEVTMNAPKINVRCAHVKQVDNWSLSFFEEEDTINQQNYLNILKEVILQKKRFHKEIIVQQDGAL